MGRLTGIQFPAAPILKSDSSSTFSLWCFVKDETYVLPIPIMLNNVIDQIRTTVGHSENPFIAKCSYLVLCGVLS
jgi:hypothetical protein